MKWSILFVLLLLLPLASAYDAIVVVSGSVKSPNQVALTAYSPRMKIFAAPPSTGAAPIANGDTTTRYDTQAFSSVQSNLIQLNPGAKYYVTMTFAALCTYVGREFTYLTSSSTCVGCTPSNSGGCWGHCTADGANNFRRNTAGYIQGVGCMWNGQQYYTRCRENPDFSQTTCNGLRGDSNNPVASTAKSPGPAVFGDNDVLIEFTAPQ